MERHIVHIDLDCFFVSVERLKNPSLKEKPVLVGGYSERSVVASCSYEARKFGVHSAMPMKTALRLCPQGVVVKASFEDYSYYSKMVTAIIREAAPIVEKASIDEHYLDITGMDKYFGCWKWSKSLRQRIIKETGLPISFALSSCKTVSKIATGEVKPMGEIQIRSGEEKAFLAPLSIRKIPMVGQKTFQVLQEKGICFIRDLQGKTETEIKNLLGENGVAVWRKANGADLSPVVPFSEQKSISKEHTFEKDTTDDFFLKSVLGTATDELAFDLRKHGKMAGSISLKLRYSNFETVSRQMKIPYSCSDQFLLAAVTRLFEKFRVAGRLIRLIGVKLSDLIPMNYQTDLFSDVSKDLKLLKAMDQIRSDFGLDKLLRGTRFK